MIQRKFGIRMSKASVCRLLNHLGLTPQRPVWRAYQQQLQVVRKWLDQEYPRIRELARRYKEKIIIRDEAAVASGHHAGTMWVDRGKAPVVRTTRSRFGLNMIAAVSVQGEFRFVTVQGHVKAPVFIEFIKRLIHGTDQMIFLIVDGHFTHRAKCVRKFVESEEIPKRFRLFSLPTYSPELNPDERVWNDLKNNGIGRKVITSAEQMKSLVIDFLRFIQKSPERVSGYFNKSTTRYAAIV